MSDIQQMSQELQKQKQQFEQEQTVQNLDIRQCLACDTPNEQAPTYNAKVITTESVNVTERSHSLPQQMTTPFAQTESDYQSATENGGQLVASHSEDFIRLTRLNKQQESGPYIGWKSEQGFRAYQEDRCVEKLGFYSTQESYHAPRQLIPSGLQKYSGLLKEPSLDHRYDVPYSFHYFAVFDGHGGDVASSFCEKNMAKILEKRLKLNLSHVYTISSVELAQDHSQENVQFIQTDLYDVDELEGDGEGGSSGLSDKKLVDVKEEGSMETEISDLDIKEYGDKVEKSLNEAFIQTDEMFSKLQLENQDMSGSTALVMLLNQHSIYVGNVGDSRAVLCRSGEALPLSDDHKADRVDEVARVQGLGGHVLHWNGMRVMGVLAMSRAIGDTQLKPYIIPEPEVTVVHRKKSDQLVIMASDGLWDVFDNQEACMLSLKCLWKAHQRGQNRRQATRTAASVLAKTAINRGSRDNVTVLVVDLKPKDQHFTKEELQVAINRYKKQQQKEDLQIVNSTHEQLDEVNSAGDIKDQVPVSPFVNSLKQNQQ